jgi:1-deoxy-D-xylulose-5-phosphate synthase
MAPKDAFELKAMLELALQHNGPSAIRYPRGKVQPSVISHHHTQVSFDIGEGEILKTGNDIAIIAVGNCIYPAQSAAESLERDGISVMVVNARFLKPLDLNLLISIASRIKRIITVEENTLAGGFGSAVLELLNDREIPDVKIRRLGIPDKFIPQGQQDELREKYGLDEEGIYQAALSILNEPLPYHH